MSDYQHQSGPQPRTPSRTSQLVRPIVVGVDGSPGGELALRWATRTARLRRLPLRVILVSDNSLPSYQPYTPPQSAETFMLREPAYTFWSIPDLDIYYADCVIGGPGSFVLPVDDASQLADAIRRKLVLEIAGAPPRLTLAAETGHAPRIDCLIGEKLRRGWQGP
jgi:nucleotide-binding universal stress UspA family protein